MAGDLLSAAREYLVGSLQGESNSRESRHPWRRSWEFTALHALRVEQYTLRILERQPQGLCGGEVQLLRLAAILHDIARLGNLPSHAKAGAGMAEAWLQGQTGAGLSVNDIERVVDLIASHSDKQGGEPDLCKAVLKDADTLDEIGAMSIFMTANWLEKESPFFFYHLHKRLVDFELPFCDQQMAILNTEGAREILREKRLFIEGFIAQLSNELQADERIEQTLLGHSDGRTE